MLNCLTLINLPRVKSAQNGILDYEIGPRHNPCTVDGLIVTAAEPDASMRPLMHSAAVSFPLVMGAIDVGQGNRRLQVARVSDCWSKV
jgi:hypothetical protein